MRLNFIYIFLAFSVLSPAVAVPLPISTTQNLHPRGIPYDGPSTYVPRGGSRALPLPKVTFDPLAAMSPESKEWITEKVRTYHKDVYDHPTRNEKVRDARFAVVHKPWETSGHRSLNGEKMERVTVHYYLSEADRNELGVVTFDRHNTPESHQINTPPNPPPRSLWWSPPPSSA